jgi:hypothetical protein
LAQKYNVDLKKIMGVNVAFDIADNTDDIEPEVSKNFPQQPIGRNQDFMANGGSFESMANKEPTKTPDHPH